MRYYIADNHFFHTAINSRMDCRGFPDVETMNEHMISQWNSRVHKNDEVVILGDLSYGSVEQTTEVVKRLKGKKYLIVGNHDKFIRSKKFDQSLFQFVDGYHEMNDNGRRVILCHYPILCYDGQFRFDKEGNPKCYMLHGHIHSTQDITVLELAKDFARNYRRVIYGKADTETPVNIINCFCMFSDYVPLTLDEWIAKEKSGELNRPKEDWKQNVSV